ncbi:MAG: exo-alpha-sialidase [Planctomycetaceae bacterium]|nr:exo-alpha-sialidase [Planctomycetaceae bacterium]
MKYRRMPWIFLLLLSTSLWELNGAEPIAEFDAARGIKGSGWTVANDKPLRAEITVAGGVLRIADEESNGQSEDAYFHRELTAQQRAEARSSGFVYQWSLRIPQDTGGSTRAISTEVCVAAHDPKSLLRFGLQFGRRGSKLIAAIHRGSDGSLEKTVKVDDPDAFHDWMLVFDGKTQVVNLLLDKQLLLQARLDNQDLGHHLVFGSRSTGQGISEWKYVRFSLGTGKHKIIEPPPSASPRFWIMAKEKASVPKHIDVFRGGMDGYFAYRIPSLIVAPNGDLLVFCEARKANLSDDGDIDLLMKRSTDGGVTWLPQQLIYEEGGKAQIKYGNPTTVVDEETGVLWLAANRDYLTERGTRAGGTLVLFRSDDSGKTWSKPLDISAWIKKPNWGHYAFGPGVGMQIRHGEHKGRLLIPANFRESFDKRQPSYSHVLFSDDHGKTWKLGGILGAYTNECQVAEIIEKGKTGLLINMRNHWGRGGFPKKSGNRLIARSFDGGQSWDTESMDVALPEPPCQASLYRYSFATNVEPSRLLFANPIGPGRANLRIRLSLDEGRTWPQGKLVAVGPAAYSCIARLPGNRVGIVYEGGNYQRISFSSFPIDELMPTEP